MLSKNNPKTLIALAAALFTSASFAQSTTFTQSGLYGTVNAQGTSTLVQLDPATGAVLSTIGNVGYIVNGLTYDPVSGNLYATTSANSSNFANGLIIIDRSTGAATPVGSGSGIGLVNVVTASGDGRLFGWTEESDDLVVWNAAAGTATVVGDSAVSTFSQSLAFDKQTGRLFLLNGDGRIYTVNTATGAVTHVVTLATQGAHHGDFSIDGRVYAIDANGSGAKNIRIIDPDTGAEIGTLATVNDLHTLAFILEQAAAGPSAADTMAALQANGVSLRRIFSLMASSVNPGLSYDCTTFDVRGICVGVLGRHTSTSGSGGEATSGGLIASYKVNPNLRVGGFVEQRTGSVSVPGLRLHSGSPTLGFFGNWAQTANGEGFSVRAAYRYSKADVTLTRAVMGTSELGTGTAELTTHGLQFTVNHATRINPAWSVSPYAGLRQIRVKRAGYTESNNIAAPLSYGALTETATQLLLGAEATGQLTPSLALVASAGVEHDLKNRTSDYSATGVAGLTPFAFSDDMQRTRPVASVGARYNLNRNMQLAARVVYRKEAFSSTSTSTGIVTFSAGF
jgi:hypothetical protein